MYFVLLQENKVDSGIGTIVLTSISSNNKQMDTSEAVPVATLP